MPDNAIFFVKRPVDLDTTGPLQEYGHYNEPASMDHVQSDGVSNVDRRKLQLVDYSERTVEAVSVQSDLVRLRFRDKVCRIYLPSQ